jgi:hypothetical protein
MQLIKLKLKLKCTYTQLECTYGLQAHQHGPHVVSHYSCLVSQYLHYYTHIGCSILTLL